MAGRITSIYLSESIYQKAKAQGLNVSKVCRDALNDALAVSVSEEEYQAELLEARRRVEELMAEREGTMALRKAAREWINAPGRTLASVTKSLHLAGRFKMTREAFLSMAEEDLGE